MGKATGAKSKIAKAKAHAKQRQKNNNNNSNKYYTRGGRWQRSAGTVTTRRCLTHTTIAGS